MKFYIYISAYSSFNAWYINRNKKYIPTSWSSLLLRMSVFVAVDGTSMKRKKKEMMKKKRIDDDEQRHERKKR